MHEKKPDGLNILNDLLAQYPNWATFAEKVTELTRRLVDEPRWKLQRVRRHTTLGRGDIFDTALGTGKVSLIRREVVNAQGERIGNYIDDIEIDLGDGKSTVIPLRSMPETEIMRRNNSMLGFDFFSDKLDDLDQQRIMRYISMYWPSSGNGNDFINFISFVKNIRMSMHQLITPDYGNPDKFAKYDPHMYLERFSPFHETKTYDRDGFSWDKPSPDAGFGGVYPTSHVELEFDAVRYYNREIDYRGITMLFYFLAPIHLVLQRFIQSVYAPQFNMYRKEVGSIDVINFSQYKWSPDAVIETGANMVGHFNAYVGAMLYIEEDSGVFSNSFPAPEGSFP